MLIVCWDAFPIESLLEIAFQQDRGREHNPTGTVLFFRFECSQHKIPFRFHKPVFEIKLLAKPPDQRGRLAGSSRPNQQKRTIQAQAEDVVLLRIKKDLIRQSEPFDDFLLYPGNDIGFPFLLLKIPFQDFFGVDILFFLKNLQ